MINPPDKSESQNQANENPVDSKFTRDALVLTLPALAKDLSPKELPTYQSNGVVILDIRRNEEWTDTVSYTHLTLPTTPYV